MKNIILPLDFSDTTDLLVAEAIKFAKEIGGHISLIHVDSTNLGLVTDMSFEYHPEKEQERYQKELAALEMIAANIRAAGVDSDFIIKEGNPSELILDYAKEKGAAYIVMGSHGRSGMYDVFIGSLTKTLTKLSPLPVLVIPCHTKSDH